MKKIRFFFSLLMILPLFIQLSLNAIGASKIGKNNLD